MSNDRPSPPKPETRQPETRQPETRPARRKSGPQALSQLLPGMIEPVLRQRGFANTTILTEWVEIAGPILAANSAPVELKWPKRQGDAGEGAPARSARLEKSRKATLVVISTSAAALDLQMMSAQLRETINRRLGFDCIGTIQIRQGTLPPKQVRRPRLADDPRLIRQISAGLDDIGDANLREALARLGAGIAQKQARG